MYTEFSFTFCLPVAKHCLLKGVSPSVSHSPFLAPIFMGSWSVYLSWAVPSYSTPEQCDWFQPSLQVLAKLGRGKGSSETWQQTSDDLPGNRKYVCIQNMKVMSLLTSREIRSFPNSSRLLFKGCRTGANTLFFVSVWFCFFFPLSPLLSPRNYSVYWSWLLDSET